MKITHTGIKTQSHRGRTAHFIIIDDPMPIGRMPIQWREVFLWALAGTIIVVATVLAAT